MINKQAKAELDSIAKKNDNALSPQAVLKFARRAKSSALWKYFDDNGLWDDTQAAELARIEFSRRMIRQYTVRYVEGRAMTDLRKWVSVTETRAPKTPSYLRREDIMSDEDKRIKFQRDLLRDLRSLIRRYRDLLSDEQVAQLEAIALHGYYEPPNLAAGPST